jgi:Flp pilus assembly protein TadD
MRMGIAYEVQSNYRMAEKQFAQALDFKPNDAIAASNLYHAAVNGGRQHVAYKRYMSFTKEQKTLVLGEDSSFDSH